MGIHEVGIRKSILKNSQNFRTSKAASLSENEEPGPSPPMFDKFKDRVRVIDYPWFDTKINYFLLVVK